MTNNHEECSNDITLQNLTCSVQIYNYRGYKYLCRKSSKRKFFGVVSLAFSTLL